LSSSNYHGTKKNSSSQCKLFTVHYLATLKIDYSVLLLYRKGSTNEPQGQKANDKSHLLDTLIKDMAQHFSMVGPIDDKRINDETKEITRIEFRNDLTKTQLFDVMVPAMLLECGAGVMEERVQPRRKLISKVRWIAVWRCTR